jgi:hypothetical protein
MRAIQLVRTLTDLAVAAVIDVSGKAAASANRFNYIG